eukprot:4754993-Pleurochrysis_carterae.AAC.4
MAQAPRWPSTLRSERRPILRSANRRPAADSRHLTSSPAACCARDEQLRCSQYDLNAQAAHAVGVSSTRSFKLPAVQPRPFSAVETSPVLA